MTKQIKSEQKKKKKTKQNYVEPTKINRLSDYREGQIKMKQTRKQKL